MRYTDPYKYTAADLYYQITGVRGHDAKQRVALIDKALRQMCRQARQATLETHGFLWQRLARPGTLRSQAVKLWRADSNGKQYVFLVPTE